VIVLVLLLASLIVLLWVGTFLFQGYIYTEPSQGLFWQAPATGAILALGYTIWCLTIAFDSKSTLTNIPVNTIIRFTPWEDMSDQPAPRIIAIKKSVNKATEGKDGETIVYVPKKDDQGFTVYRDTTVKHGTWQSQSIIAFEMEKTDGTKTRFDFVKDDAGGQYVSSDGWVMPMNKYESPTGIPRKFYFSRLVLNFVYNTAHFVAWFITLWLLMRYQMMHALGLAIVMWVITTLILLPIILALAAEVAMSRQTRVALDWVATTLV